MRGLGDPFLQIKLKAKSTEEGIIETIYTVMRKFSYTLQEVLNLPLPTFIALLRLMEKEAKEEEKLNKKYSSKKIR